MISNKHWTVISRTVLRADTLGKPRLEQLKLGSGRQVNLFPDELDHGDRSSGTRRPSGGRAIGWRSNAGWRTCRSLAKAPHPGRYASSESVGFSRLAVCHQFQLVVKVSPKPPDSSRLQPGFSIMVSTLVQARLAAADPSCAPDMTARLTDLKPPRKTTTISLGLICHPNAGPRALCIRDQPI